MYFFLQIKKILLAASSIGTIKINSNLTSTLIGGIWLPIVWGLTDKTSEINVFYQSIMI